METVEATLGMLVAITALAVIARRIAVPYPILLVFGGLGISLVPGLPHVELEPEVFFLVFLAPLLFADAWLMPLRDFKAELRPILLLAIGLVAFTTLVVGYAAHAIVGLELPVAFALGAVISPTDAVAVGSITHRMRIPHRLTTIINGESLVNDASGLVGLKLAVAAALTGTFHAARVVPEFLWLAVAGLVAGLAVGWAACWFRRWYARGGEPDPLIDIAVSFLTPYAAYLAGESIEASGILSVVAAGLYGGYRDPMQMTAQSRQRAWAAWETAVFLLNGLVFILLGLQFRQVMHGLSSHAPSSLALYAAVVSGLAIVTRLVWIFPGAYLPRMLFKRIRETEPFPPPRQIFIAGWSGMRGTVTLAGALSLPLVIPGRDMVIFLAFSVILVTLVVQGFSLPVFIRRLGIQADDARRREEVAGRIRAAQAAVKGVEGIDGADPALAAGIVGEYEERIERLAAEDGHRHDAGERGEEEKRLRLAAIDAERAEAIRLRNSGAINDEALRAIQHDIDLEETRARGGGVTPH